MRLIALVHWVMKLTLAFVTPSFSMDMQYAIQFIVADMDNEKSIDEKETV